MAYPLLGSDAALVILLELVYSWKRGRRVSILYRKPAESDDIDCIANCSPTASCSHFRTSEFKPSQPMSKLGSNWLCSDDNRVVVLTEIEASYWDIELQVVLNKTLIGLSALISFTWSISFSNISSNVDRGSQYFSVVDFSTGNCLILCSPVVNTSVKLLNWKLERAEIEIFPVILRRLVNRCPRPST